MEDEMDDEVYTIGYELCEPFLDLGAMLAESYLHMPSGLVTYDHVIWSCPRVVMDIKNPDDIHCLELMMTSAHKNILHAKIITAEQGCNVVWTEPFTGTLITLLQQMKSNLGDFTHMVPSVPLRIIVSQWFDGIGHLRCCGKYHGDFRLDNTYYLMASGICSVKLTNFRWKGKTEKFKKHEDFLIHCQLEDVWAIARGLDEICNIAARQKRTLDCCLVIDLAKKLREVSKENLVSVMKDIKKHMFFWDEIDRERFYVCDLPYALKNSKFRDDVEASSSICIEHWDSDNYSGLLGDMNAYRKLHNLDPYDGTKKIHFCSFCSGLYTHEFELPRVKFGQLRVDEVLQCRNPKACYEIVCLMPDREKKYMLSKREEIDRGGVASKIWRPGVAALSRMMDRLNVICICSKRNTNLASKAANLAF